MASSCRINRDPQRLIIANVLPHSTQRESLYSCLQNVSCESSSLANKWPTSAGASEIYILYRSGEGLVRYSVQHGAPAVSALMQYGAGDYLHCAVIGSPGNISCRNVRAVPPRSSRRITSKSTHEPHEHIQTRAHAEPHLPENLRICVRVCVHAKPHLERNAAIQAGLSTFLGGCEACGK